jgi:hypothetical protein
MISTYIEFFIKIGSAIQKWIGGDTQTHRQHGDLIGLLLFFQNKESSVKRILAAERKTCCRHLPFRVCRYAEDMLR